MHSSLQLCVCVSFKQLGLIVKYESTQFFICALVPALAIVLSPRFETVL